MTQEEPKTDSVILKVEDLKVFFPIVGRGILQRTIGYVRAVDEVSFEIFEGETLGLVGESGCGKTTVGRALMGAVEATGGSVKFTTRDGGELSLLDASKADWSIARQQMQLVFQDPFSSLNPRMTIYDIVGDPLRVNKLAGVREREERVAEMVRRVGLPPEVIRRYPHAFSGGQRQRIGIARALIMNPRLVIADEPVSALDVSVQAQILNLMQELRDQLNLSYLFISHDLSVVQHVSDRVAVMYVGQLVEVASSKSIFARPMHPYTQALLSSVPLPNPEIRSRGKALEGEVADPANPPGGCYFNPRCPFVQDICRTETPPLTEVEPGRFARCHFAGELELAGVAE
ncbi:MAG: ATP-binding cassette domain-containing protein [Dehalococcoidia bacterium]|nr:ATP-binding cassette domain-containing protein [Dehalococcoidia bacterium]